VDKERFISTIKDNQRIIHKVCNTYCRNEEHRKDLEQEILEQLWKSMHRFDGRVKVSTWIYQVALNTAFLFYRNESKHHKKKVSIDDSVITIADENIDPELERRVAKLYRFIDTLDELDKALMLLYLDSCKQKDIAEILGISETNVATKVSRIKAKMKKEFSPKQTISHYGNG